MSDTPTRLDDSTFAIQRLADEDFENLAPLVGNGEDRDDIIKQIVEQCWTTSQDDDPRRYVQDGGFVLREKKLVDGNTNEPIDLSELSKLVSDRVKKQARRSGEPGTAHLILVNCSIPLCQLHDVEVRHSLLCVGCLIGPDADFSETLFQAPVGFPGSRFVGAARFKAARLPHHVDLRQAVFGDDTDFLGTMFGDHARFDRASFGDNVSFQFAQFGNEARFDHVTFGHYAGFGAAKIGSHCRFHASRFGKLADFSESTFGDCANFQETDFQEYARFERVSFGDRADFHSAHFNANAKWVEARFGRETRFTSSQFGAETDFHLAAFGEKADFSAVSFGPRASFNAAEFAQGARFADARFEFEASFESTRFGPFAQFQRVSFDNDALFHQASFGDRLRFDEASFGAQARFDSTHFGNDVRFIGTTFGPDVRFVAARFDDFARFDEARFGDNARFDAVTFDNDASFRSCRFGHSARFDASSFGLRANFDAARFGTGLSMAGVTFEPPGGIDGVTVALRPDDPARSLPRRLTKFLNRLDRWFDWNRVRSVGELHVLTKATYTALLVVPIVAGTWRTVRVFLDGVHQSVREVKQEFDASAQELQATIERIDQEAPSEALEVDQLRALIEQLEAEIERLYEKHGPVVWTDPDLPPSWMAGYLAALWVALGHLIYQIGAPEKIKKSSREAFREQRNQEFRQASDLEQRDLIERAFPPLREVAERFPHERHPDLVKRHDRAIWLPNRYEALERHETAIQARAHQESQQPATPDESQESMIAAQRKQGHSGNDRTRRAPRYSRRQLELVIIDEGAAAEYDLDAHEHRFWAWASFLLYNVGGLSVLVMIILQLKIVLESAGYSWVLIFGILLIPVVLAVIASVSLWLPRRLQERENVERASEE